MRLCVPQDISRERPFQLARLLICPIALISKSNLCTDHMLRCCVLTTLGGHLCKMSEHVNDILSHFKPHREVSMAREDILESGSSCSRLCYGQKTIKNARMVDYVPLSFKYQEQTPLYSSPCNDFCPSEVRGDTMRTSAAR
jgi:hypothetical protein